MNDANAKANAMPAEPASPPARILSGAKDAAKLSPSGPPSTRIANETMSSDASSSSMSTPSTLAPTSTLNSESPVTRSQAMSAHAHHGSRPNSPETTTPKKP